MRHQHAGLGEGSMTPRVALALIAIAFAIFPGSILPGTARAQAAYPSRPVKVMVGFPPGTAADITAPLLDQKLSEILGQQFIVENRPGASSTIAVELVV